MALDFPNSPTIGQTYPSPAITEQPQYTWDGEKWASGTGYGNIYIADSAPAAPVGSLWWNSATGILCVRYYDGNSTQWVGMVGAPQLQVLPKHLSGLTLSNDAVSPNTVLDIATGSAASDDDTTMMVLTAPFTKNCNAAFAAGSGNGALDTGSTAVNSVWYYVFLIERMDTFAVDVLISQSLTSPVMPANYTKKRRIRGAFSFTSSAIIPFTQLGDQFLWVTPRADLSNISVSTTPALFTLSVPGRVIVLFTAYLASVPAGAVLTFRSPDQPMSAGNTPPGDISMSSQAGGSSQGGDFQIRTNASGQISIASNIAVTSGFYLITKGWIDQGGK